MSSSAADHSNVGAHQWMLDRLRGAMTESGRGNRKLAVLLIHLTRFRTVHVRVGYDAAERLMDGIEANLPGLLRSDDFVARLWGHDLAVVLPALSSPAQAELAAQRILHRFEEPVMVDGQLMFLPVQIGGAFYPGDGETAEALLQSAERALIEALDGGHNVTFYTKPQETLSVADGELRDVVLNNRLRLYLQPLVDIKTGAVVSAEALARWPRDGRSVSPAAFVAQAERCGLIMDLTRWSLNAALRVSSESRQRGRFLPVSVNLSPRVIQEKGLVEHILDALNIWGVPSDHLTVEVTENALMKDPDLCTRVLARLGAAGVRIAIDDFGVGYSSFAYLKCFVVDELKIDKTFMSGLLEDEKTLRLVEAMIDLGHRLGIKVVAEGVESREVLDRLADLGCDYVQGFFTGIPAPAERFL